MTERESKDRNEEREGGELKVTDRRLFTPTGELREALPDEEAGGPTPEAGSGEPAPHKETGPEPTGFQHRPVEEPEGVDFTMLLNAMAHPALIFLGEVPHPDTGRPEVNLEQARLQINLLDLLRVKCRGNLTHEEEGLLERLLYQLKMLYVSRSSGPSASSSSSSS